MLLYEFKMKINVGKKTYVSDLSLTCIEDVKTSIIVFIVGLSIVYSTYSLISFIF